MTLDDIGLALAELGIARDATVMVHADAGIAAQLRTLEPDDRLPMCVETLKAYFAEQGTLIVPSFTYSATQGQDFDVAQTRSAVGQFSEVFRTSANVQRSAHPIFALSVYGRKVNQFLNAQLTDCFGSGSAFDLLYQEDATIVCLGCDVSRITFVHYVEQAQAVSYRYMKSFQSRVIENGQSVSGTVDYFVRDLDRNTGCDLEWLKAEAVKRGAMKSAPIGRFEALSIRTRDFFGVASDLLNSNPYALIAERHAS